MTEPSQRTLVGSETLLKSLFINEADRPCLRWLQQQRKLGTIPFIRLGRRVWFDLDAVRAAIVAQSHEGGAHE